ncbi:MAG: hypothetical protein IH867_12885, partial [Chloroflexi bacterium]|nr:hypothetical protein [Chloroflexota bacterium]
MSTRRELLESVADTISDYRESEVAPRTPARIESWMKQFPEASQDPLLDALVHVLATTYISKDKFK